MPTSSTECASSHALQVLYLISIVQRCTCSQTKQSCVLAIRKAQSHSCIRYHGSICVIKLHIHLAMNKPLIERLSSQLIMTSPSCFPRIFNILAASYPKQGQNPQAREIPMCRLATTFQCGATSCEFWKKFLLCFHILTCTRTDFPLWWLQLWWPRSISILA